MNAIRPVAYAGRVSTSPAVPAIVARLRAAGCVSAEDEARLLASAARTPAELQAMVDRRVSGVPVEHVLGWARFCGIRVAVAPGVFVPRPRTCLLVRAAVALAGQDGTTVVDLCCGSGAVGAAVATTTASRIRLVAADLDPAAVACARRNLAPLGARVFQGDLFDALPDRLRHRVDLLVANLPYVPTGAIGLLPPEARLYEPRQALDGGADGLDLLRRVAAGASGWLAPGGHLLVETSHQQAPAAGRAFARAGLTPRVVRDDELEATVLIGHFAGSAELLDN